ncbi:MAG TPA: DUF386 domain-containing protein, partial [Dehalococcoidia bacterium]|nr:DUF386 domain-containing protein [Dehalococcoidia bacterium]
MIVWRRFPISTRQAPEEENRMILDRITNGERYACLSRDFARAFELLKQGDIARKEEGKYEVEGNRLYFMVQNYITKLAEERRFEAHRRYADIQAV